MVRPRWKKVLHDLWDNKARTLTVVFSIAIGVFAIGVIAGAYVIISEDLRLSYAAAAPYNVELRMADFNRELLDAVRDEEGVARAEGRRVFYARVRAAGATRWVGMDMVAFDDFQANSINLLTPLQGKATPEKRQVVLERSVLDSLSIQAGQALEVQLPDGSVRRLQVVGIVQDTAMGAGDFLALPFMYIAWETLSYLKEPEAYNRLYVTVAEQGDDIEYIRDFGARLRNTVEKRGGYVVRLRFALSNKHPLTDPVNAILGVLLALGVLIVFLSGSLIANTLAALLQQHIRHIGVIKMIGGRSEQVFGMYMTLILAFGLLALLIAIPSGGQGAYALAEFVADRMNFRLMGYRLVPTAVAIQVVLGLLIPLIAGFVPVWNGSRVTVLQAISGEMARPGRPLAKRATALDNPQPRPAEFIGRWQRMNVLLPRPFLLSLRNTFRRRARLILTLFTLSMGGAIFIAVFNVRLTLNDYMDAIARYFVADVLLDFRSPYRLREVEQVLKRVPDVLRVEGWHLVSGELLDPRGRVLENINIIAPPAYSPLIQPMLVEGRWIRADDVRKFAISETAYKYYPNLKPGDRLKIVLFGEEETWEVVGIFKFIDREGILAYAPYEYISQQVGLTQRAFVFRVATSRHDRAYQDAKAEELDAFLRAQGYHLRRAEAGQASLDLAVDSLNTIVVFLLIMAVLTAIVGSIGLTGTMSMNVMERTREIGILRAIGADDRAVSGLVLGEGVLIGLISFVFAVGLSIPITYLLATIISLTVFQTPVEVLFTVTGYVSWLGMVIGLSAVASLLPARNAARLTVREVLAYE